MKYLFASVAVVTSLICGAARAEEDPSYEPSKPVKKPPPKSAVALPDLIAPSNSTSAPKAEPKKERAQTPPPAREPVYTPRTVVEPAAPTGPKVKYILDGKPVYEGDPDPVAESEARAKIEKNSPRNSSTAKDERNVKVEKKDSGYYERSPLIIRESVTPAPTPQQREPVAPRNVYAPPPEQNVTVTTPAPRNGPVRLDFAASVPPNSAQPPAPPVVRATPAPDRKVKYILDGRPVYEGDPDPLPGANRGTALAPINGGARSPLGVEDVTADKPLAGAKAGQEVRGQLVLEEYAAAGPVNSRAKKGYEMLAAIKTDVETISRYMEARGKNNADLIHTSEALLDDINKLAKVWPESTAFIDVASTAKRSALLYNHELGEVPWTWTRVRWSYEAMVREVQSLRSYAKTMAESEPPPVAVQLKNGQVVYQDVPDVIVDPATAKREAVMKATREDMARMKRAEALREAERGKLNTTLDGN